MLLGQYWDSGERQCGSVGTGYGYGWGMGGWVIRVGIPGYYPAPARRSCYQRSGPRKPSKGWSGWVAGPGASEPHDHPLRDPAGPYGARSAVMSLSSGKRRLWANKGEIQ